MAEQGVDERAVRIARSGVDNHARRLVDDDQMCILEADVERDRLRRRCRILNLGRITTKFWSQCTRAAGVANRRALLGDMAGFDQPFEPGARHRREVARQHAVEALPGLAVTGPDLSRCRQGLVLAVTIKRLCRIGARRTAGRAACARSKSWSWSWASCSSVGFAALVAIVAGRISRGGTCPVAASRSQPGDRHPARRAHRGDDRRDGPAGPGLVAPRRRAAAPDHRYGNWRPPGHDRVAAGTLTSADSGDLASQAEPAVAAGRFSHPCIEHVPRMRKCRLESRAIIPNFSPSRTVGPGGTDIERPCDPSQPPAQAARFITQHRARRRREPPDAPSAGSDARWHRRRSRAPRRFPVNGKPPFLLFEDRGISA